MRSRQDKRRRNLEIRYLEGVCRRRARLGSAPRTRGQVQAVVSTCVANPRIHRPEGVLST